MLLSFSAVACSPSGQTQAANNTTQNGAAQYMNDELLKIVCKIELYT
jgi:hypothetical protein